MNKSQMTRSCSACGLEKPLAAFLEISATSGTRYGSICSTCRSSKITESNNKKTEDEQGSTATTGTRIGAKERVFIEKEQQKQDTTAKETRINELNKRDFLNEEKKEKTAKKNNAEKDHRRTYLDARQQPGFLGKKLPPGSIVRTPPPKNQETTPLPSTKKEQEKTVLDKKQLEMDAAQQDTKNKNINLRDQFIDPQAGEARAHSASFLAFQDSLEVTPFKIAKERAKALASANQQKINKGKNTASKDPLLDFIEKNWSSPNSTRKR